MFSGNGKSERLANLKHMGLLFGGDATFALPTSNGRR